jgi:hypothetical protein
MNFKSFATTPQLVDLICMLSCFRMWLISSITFCGRFITGACEIRVSVRVVLHVNNHFIWKYSNVFKLK